MWFHFSKRIFQKNDKHTCRKELSILSQILAPVSASYACLDSCVKSWPVSLIQLAGAVGCEAL